MSKDYVAEHQVFVTDVLEKVKSGDLSVENACISINSLIYRVSKDSEDNTRNMVTADAGFELLDIAQRWLRKSDPHIAHEWQLFLTERHKK